MREGVTKLRSDWEEWRGRLEVPMMSDSVGSPSFMLVSFFSASATLWVLFLRMMQGGWRGKGLVGGAKTAVSVWMATSAVGSSAGASFRRLKQAVQHLPHLHHHHPVLSTRAAAQSPARAPPALAAPEYLQPSPAMPPD